jgi:hypothetical protein
MKRFLVILGVIAFIFSMAGSASAISFSGTTLGAWNDVISTDSDDIWSINNNDSGWEAIFNWGVAIGMPFNNQFTFNGIGSDGGTGWSANSEDPFLIGEFSYRNGSTVNSIGINGVTLDINLSITDPTGITGGYNFDFSITNTPNTTGDPVEDGDIVTYINDCSNTSFTVWDANLGVDIEYTLKMLGFSNDGGFTIRADFSSPEGSAATAGIYAQITSHISPSPVPEPATIFLLGSGIIGLARIRKIHFGVSSTSVRNYTLAYYTRNK